MANIKVAVRVRPISARELNLTGSEVVVHTNLNEISLTNLKVSSSKAGDSRERTRKYGFDYCFDSSKPEADNFADQQKIYQTLGQTVLDAIFSGYNSCLVAYGQSASGKTYTMMGTKDDPGLTPRLCEGLFSRLEEESRNERDYCVSVSYLEIYNERVRDLLKPCSSTSGLRVREHPRLGPYVQGLTHHVVNTLGALMSYVEEGTKARKTASTLQNPSSSRSHALLTIAVAEESSGIPSSNSSNTKRKESWPRGGSKLRLVDLAGSESAATCSGVHRLKEGANINKSLVALGNVISALAERGSTGSGPGRRFIPYRDSSLTWLLKDALGGNATTIMLATISPASGSYNETAHTLRFAQRAQSVVNRPVVNVDPVARIIRELRAEVVRLKSLLLEKNIEPDTRVLCCCKRSQFDCSKDQFLDGGRDPVETVSQNSRGNLQENSRVEKEEKGLKSVLALRRSNSSDSVTKCEVGSIKKFGSLGFLAGDRFAGNYNRAKVAELDEEEDEISEIHESVFVDIPTLVAVLIKPDDNLQESSAQIEEICSDEAAEEAIDVCQFVGRANEGFGESEKPDSGDHEERSSSVNSCHVPADNEEEIYENPEHWQVKSPRKPREKPKFRKQDSVDVLSPSLLSNLHTSKKFGSVETIQRKKDPPFSLERSHTNLEKRSTVDRVKKLNNIREIDDQRAVNKNLWRGSKEQLQRKGSNDSDKSLKDSGSQLGSKLKNHARKPSLENLKRKTSKDSSSSSSKDEQILISSLARDKLLGRKSSLEQEPTSIRSHTPIQKVKRAEIVAAVTERLYSSRKPMEEASGIRSPPESSDGKSAARMRLQEISRKMLGKRRRVCVDTQTDFSRTIRMKDTACLTETPQIVLQDVAVLTDQNETCDYAGNAQKTPVLRVKEAATLTEKPKANIVRCKDMGSLANDLEEYDYEIHSPRNDSGILSDDTQNYAESNISSTEVSDLCPEADRRAYAESSTNTSMFSSCRSFAVQTPEVLPAENKISRRGCLRQCCNEVSQNNSEKSVISISLPDTICITIKSTNHLESRIALTDNEASQTSPVSKDREAQTEDDLRNEIFRSRDQTRSTPSQTDGRVFRIENIFQDPNNAAKNSRADADRAEGARIRNSITFRNSLGTSYVSQQPGESTSRGLRTEGFVRDGLITEAFINRKHGFRRAPSAVVYENPWKNWTTSSASTSLEDDSRLVNRGKELGIAQNFWEPEVVEISSSQGGNLGGSESGAGILENGTNFGQSEIVNGKVAGLINEEEGGSELMKITTSSSSSSSVTLSSNLDHDYGFSDDSLDYGENNLSKEAGTVTKAKRKSEQRKNHFCPPDVVAHTKKDSAKSSAEAEKNDFEDNQVEFPKKNPIESVDATKIHDYKSLILGRPSVNYEETNEESDSASSSHASNFGKKKVSFCNSEFPVKSLNRDTKLNGLTAESLGQLRPTLKSIIKKRKKKPVTESSSLINSSNDETDDYSQQEEKAGVALEFNWKAEARSASSEEAKEERSSLESKGNSVQEGNRKKVNFSVVELENTCSESDSCENPEEDEEEEDVPPDCGSRNVLEEYLNEAVAFMRNLNSISEYVNGTRMLERHPASPCRNRGRREARRRNCSWNRDYLEQLGRNVSPKDEEEDYANYPVEDDDIVVSTASYDRCLKGIQRLEECIRRVDKHNELLSSKYGVNLESAGARPDLASSRTDPRIFSLNSDFKIPARKGNCNVEKPKKEEEDDLEKKIFDQLMNVANSIRYGSSNKLQTRFSDLSADPEPNPSISYSKFRDNSGCATREPFLADLSGSLSLEETSNGNGDSEDYTTYEITGNLSVGRTCFGEESHEDFESTLEEDYLPLRRFKSFSWSSDVDSSRASPSEQKDPSRYSFLSKRESFDPRTLYDDSSTKFPSNGLKTNFCTQRLSADQFDPWMNLREKFQETDSDYSWRTRDGGCRVCACSKDLDVEGASKSSEIVHLRDKLKYPGSPRARFLELLRERRRIVECSRGTSAS